MVKRYPHTCIIKWNDPPTTVNGEAVEGADHSVSTICRLEPNNSKWIPGAEGDNPPSLGWVIYAPLITEEFPPYVKVVLTEGEFTGRLAKYQRHIRIWV